MTFLPMDNNQEKGSFWILKQNKTPEWNEWNKKYHSLNFVKNQTSICIKENPIPNEKLQRCRNQFNETFSQAFWDQFMINTLEIVEKMANLDGKKEEKMKELFSKSMMS